jgi:lysophospholipase L1-like esterase
MAGKIAFSDLVAKIQNKDIGRKEIAKYFVVDEAKSKSFAPVLTLNYGAVDTTGAERSAKLAAPALAAEASLAAKSNRAKTAATAAVQPAIVAEGDSWFNLPDIVYPETIIDVLRVDHVIANLAMYGDELEEMVLRAEYMPRLATGNIRFLLFSGGGNDVIGGGALSTCLNLYDPHHTDPKQAAYYVNSLFDAVLERVEKLYRRVAAQVRNIAPNTKIVVHGYDYAIPRNEGPHLGKPMRDRGLDPAWDGDLCNAIIRLMIDRFNDRLEKLPSENIIYLDLRGTAGKAGWFDEIHPTKATAGKMAKKFAKVLGTVH